MLVFFGKIKDLIYGFYLIIHADFDLFMRSVHTRHCIGGFLEIFFLIFCLIFFKHILYKWKWPIPNHMLKESNSLHLFGSLIYVCVFSGKKEEDICMCIKKKRYMYVYMYICADCLMTLNSNLSTLLFFLLVFLR